MPIDTALANQTWARYSHCRDNGHTKFMKKADKCERFFAGDQWDPLDVAKLAAQKRPALTINKILPTTAAVMGEQIKNRAEISFRPRSGAPTANATILSKVVKQISDDNQLNWLRSAMFDDGVITSRGFIDMRMDFSRSMQGVVRYTNINPKNVVIDPDGEEMDPDTWSDVFTTKWVTADDIEVMYSKADADILRLRGDSSFVNGFDSITEDRDRFGDRTTVGYTDLSDNSGVTRAIRLVDRQYKKLASQKFFVNPKTGDMRPVPDEWDATRVEMLRAQFGFEIIKRMVRRIRWTIIADNVVLHDDWSPYEHYTIVPFFPYFRRGTTIGLVENLLGPQELLNKTTSQELHIINSSANGGYKIRQGSITNMSPEELEQRGAETGLVIEVSGDPEKDVVKLTPNNIPQGLDRLSYKAEEAIKTISNVSDSSVGQDRADVSGKAIQEKKQSGQITLIKPLDNLTRTDFFIARGTLSMVQRYYTEARVLTITHNAVKGETEDVEINQMSAEGEVINDLSLGQYDVVVTSVPVKDTLEDSEFDQCVALKEMGIDIPDEVLIQASRLQDKKSVLEKMAARSNSPEAQEQNRLALEMAQAEIDKLKAEIAKITNEAQLKGAAAEHTMVKAQKEAQPVSDDGGAQAKMAEVQVKAQSEQQKLEQQAQNDQQKMQLEYAKLDQQTQLEQQKQATEAQAAKEKAVQDRVASITATKPTTKE